MRPGEIFGFVGHHGAEISSKSKEQTFATNAQGHGNAKDVQTHLRHSDISTTLGVYTQPIDDNVRRLVNAVTADVMASEPKADSQKTPSQLNTQPWTSHL
jgi:hypothetical protein